MNLSEAHAWNHLLQSLETDAPAETRDRGLYAAEFLTKRARVALNAGPAAPQVSVLVEDLQHAVQVAATRPECFDHDVDVVHVRLGDRSAVTTQPTGGLL